MPLPKERCEPLQNAKLKCSIRSQRHLIHPLKQVLDFLSKHGVLAGSTELGLNRFLYARSLSQKTTSLLSQKLHRFVSQSSLQVSKCARLFLSNGTVCN